MQLAFELTGGATRGRITWQRHPQLVRANYEMLLDGEPTGVWVKCCGHQTALRPFTVELPTSDPLERLVLGRKFKYADQAKAEAVQRYLPAAGADHYFGAD